jgi:hypothetical protein
MHKKFGEACGTVSYLAGVSASRRLESALITFCTDPPPPPPPHPPIQPPINGVIQDSGAGKNRSPVLFPAPDT